MEREVKGRAEFSNMIQSDTLLVFRYAFKNILLVKTMKSSCRFTLF